MIGRIRWWNVDRGWGFAQVESHPDVFVHHAAVEDDGDFRPGDMVVFQVGEGTVGPVGLRVRRSPSETALPSG